MKKIRKVVIPAAGFGTRFLPETKAMPKEMLPIVDKPVIQYVVEEAVEAGIEDVIIVTGYHKRSIEDHFDYPFELEKRLEEAGKLKQLEEVRRIASMANFIYVRQKGPLGNATPILNAKHIIGNEPFLVLWGDDFIKATPSRCRQLIEGYNKYGCSMLSSMKLSKPEDETRYGYASGKEVDGGYFKVSDLIEKPGVGKRPSDYAIISGFLFTPGIFECIEEMMANKETGAGGEYVYIDALRKLLKKGEDIYAVEMQNSKFYDTGNKLEYMKTVVEFAAEHPDISGDFKNYLKEFVKTF
jgi:UTP--glucose-1-phosphate uridylyltransferase